MFVTANIKHNRKYCNVLRSKNIFPNIISDILVDNH